MVMLEEENDNEVELHIQLRNKFLQEIGDTYDKYDPDDVNRIKTDDAYCRRFILHKKGNFDQAYEMLKEALAWRKSFEVKGCTADTIPAEFFEIRGVFPFRYDKEANPIIMILVRHHRKDAKFAKEIRRFVIYWVEKMENDYEGKQMTVVMNCSDAGLNNLDLDLIKFLITLFRSYYPHSLAHILIYEMSWIFNAAWKIIKSWLPEDFVEKIVFVNKTTVLNFVEKENLPLEMGGTATEDEDENENKPQPPKKPDNDGRSLSSYSTAISRDSRRVRFPDEATTNDEFNSMNSSVNRSSYRSTSSRESLSYKVQFDDYIVIADILKVSPPQDLIFQPPGSKSELDENFIKLQNISDKAITFKIKTNNIENYRVKPSIGIIESGESTDVAVNLVKGKKPQMLDKFLIMAMQLPDSSISMPSLSHLWRIAQPTSIVDHRLRCVLLQGELTPHEQKVDQSLRYIVDTLGDIQSALTAIERRESAHARLQKVTLCLLIFFGIILWSHVICEYFGGFHIFYHRSSE